MKKTARNDVTGDWLQSKPNNEQFEKNWDLIFGKKKKESLAEYELNKSTGEVQKVNDGDTTNTSK
jgi:endonuclease YncB( thermonuclease family)